MRVAIERRRPPPIRPELVEVVTPRTNAAAITAAENLFAAVALAEPFGLEIATTSGARWFLVRADSPAMRRHLEDQLGVAYPQAALRPVDADRFPGLDPARLGQDEQVAACTLVLRRPAYLPLRTFADAQVDPERSAQADPVLGLLSAAGDLPEGWRTLHQLVLRPAPEDWCRGYLRLALEHPLAAERAAGGHDTSLRPVALAGGALIAAVLAYQGYQWYDAGAWLNLAGLAVGVGAGVPGFAWLVRRLGRRELQDPRLVQEKISRPAYVVQLRLAVFAPADAPRELVEAYLKRLAAAYRQYSLAAGNGFAARPLETRGRDLRALEPLPPAGNLPILNTHELAGLWHLPRAGADVPLLERTTARQRLPLPCTVSRGCRIGVSAQQGHAVPVALPDWLLHRHLLLVAKTRRGKSSLLLRIARHLMAQPGPGGRKRALVLVDPHRDLAEATLGCVPRERRGDVVYLDVADQARPFGLNLIDTELGWPRDKAVSNVLRIFEREWTRNWGPRMEIAFRFALMALFEANQAICANTPPGRALALLRAERDAEREAPGSLPVALPERQFTILDVPAVLTENAFRRRLLAATRDPAIAEWFASFYDNLDRRQQMEVISPVQTKIHRFAGSQAARAVVGQPRSTVDPAAWLRDGALVVANTAAGVVGEDTAALIGGTLLNLVALVVGEQADLPPADRRAVTVVADEFHSAPGADYESILAELPKYGANLLLATQSLARLDALDREHQRALRATVFSNLDGLFAFHTSAEDARYLVKELGEGVDEQDIVSLGDHRCYARISAEGERLPAFSVKLDPPPPADPALKAELVDASAQRYGRDAAAVDARLRFALARVAEHRSTPGTPAAGDTAGGEGAPGGNGRPGRGRFGGTPEDRRAARDESERDGAPDPTEGDDGDDRADGTEVEL